MDCLFSIFLCLFKHTPSFVLFTIFFFAHKSTRFHIHVLRVINWVGNIEQRTRRWVTLNNLNRFLIAFLRPFSSTCLIPFNFRSCKFIKTFNESSVSMSRPLLARPFQHNLNIQMTQEKLEIQQIFIVQWRGFEEKETATLFNRQEGKMRVENVMNQHCLCMLCVVNVALVRCRHCPSASPQIIDFLLLFFHILASIKLRGKLTIFFCLRNFVNS